MVFLFCQSVADGIDVALLPGRPSQSMPTARIARVNDLQRVSAMDERGIRSAPCGSTRINQI
jgi:hypothetical protein